jgi:hypothetical protein
MAGVWERVDALLDLGPGQATLEAHRLELLAGKRLRELHEPVPPTLAQMERLAVARELAVPALLSRVRAATEIPLLLMKGPACAVRYRATVTRPFRDLDLLTPEADSVWETLVNAGFVPLEDPADYAEHHHRAPLLWPGLPLTLEIHSRPHWTADGPPPDAAELLAGSTPGRGPLTGVRIPAPEHHAVLLAVHAREHGPLLRLGDLLDIALMSAGVEPGEIEAVARQWGCERLWQTTAAASSALFGDGAVPLSLRTWARHLPAVRERTVIEGHLARWIEPLWTAPEWRAPAVARAVAQDLRPHRNESWGPKLTRAGRVVRARGMTFTDYERARQPALPRREST